MKLDSRSWPPAVRAELRAVVQRMLAMREPRCTCGHVLTQHTSRRLLCFARGPLWGRPGCGCTGWIPEKVGAVLARTTTAPEAAPSRTQSHHQNQA